MNHLIIVLGFGLIIWFYVTPRTGEWDHVILFWYFMIQFIPNMGIELWSRKTHKAMRLLNQDAQKEAALQPRRLTDFVSKEFLGTVFAIYVIFIVFNVYIDQFNYPWFGGYLNPFIISGAYLIFGLIIYKAMYGKVKNPHQSYEDRKIDIQTSSGKLLMHLGHFGEKNSIPILAFGGAVEGSLEELKLQGITELVQISPEGQPIEDAIKKTSINLKAAISKKIREYLN